MTDYEDESEPPSVHATAAAEAIRQLNHATLNDKLRYPAEAADIIGGLKAMAERLPQAIQQTDMSLAALHAGGTLYSYDNPARFDGDMAEARALFATSEAQAHELAATLTRLQNLLGQFGMTVDE